MFFLCTSIQYNKRLKKRVVYNVMSRSTVAGLSEPPDLQFDVWKAADVSFWCVPVVRLAPSLPEDTQ